MNRCEFAVGVVFAWFVRFAVGKVQAWLVLSWSCWIGDLGFCFFFSMLCRLVKLAARAFYDDINMKGDNQQKTGRSDNRGMAVVILDALTK